MHSDAPTVRVSDLPALTADDLGERLTVIPVPDPREPDIGNSLESVASSEDAVWVVSHRGGIVSRIDTGTNAVVATVESPILPTCRPNACVGLGGIAATADQVWFYNKHSGVFVQVDTTTNAIVGSHAASGREALVAAEGLIWTGGDSGAVGMDPESGEVVTTVEDGAGLYPAGGAAGSVWFVGDECRELRRVDPETGATQATIPIDTCIGDIGAVADEVWVATFRGILRIDARLNQEIDVIRLRTDGDVELAVVGDSVWFRGKIGELVRIDAATRQPVERIRLPNGQYMGELGASDGAVWVANWREGTVYRIDE